MTDAQDASAGSEDSSDPAGDHADAGAGRDGDNIQSLTDFFDQMDRAAFKRALANRDSRREADSPPKSQRR